MENRRKQNSKSRPKLFQLASVVELSPGKGISIAPVCTSYIYTHDIERTQNVKTKPYLGMMHSLKMEFHRPRGH